MMVQPAARAVVLRRVRRVRPALRWNGGMGPPRWLRSYTSASGWVLNGAARRRRYVWPSPQPSPTGVSAVTRTASTVASGRGGEAVAIPRYRRGGGGGG